MIRASLEDVFVATILMDDFGVPEFEIKNVVPLVQAARSAGLIHCRIVASVRGFDPNPLTDNLKHYLQMSPRERAIERRKRA